MTSRLDLILWLAGFLGNSILCLVLVSRGQWSKYPIFTALAGYEALRAILLFLISHAGQHLVYVVSYWGSEFLDLLLQIALLYEIGTRSVLYRSDSGSRSSQLLSGYTVTLAALIAGICSMAVPAVASLKETVDMRACLFTSLLTCELYLLILTKVNRSTLRKSGPTMAIFNGITLWAICAVISDVCHQINGWENESTRFDEFKSIIVVIMLCYWVVVFLRPSVGAPEEHQVSSRLPLKSHLQTSSGSAR